MQFQDDAMLAHLVNIGGGSLDRSEKSSDDDTSLAELSSGATQGISKTVFSDIRQLLIQFLVSGTVTHSIVFYIYSICTIPVMSI